MKDEHIAPKTPERVSCENCGNTHFFKDGGYRYCKKCFYSVGRVFIKEVTFKDRCCFRQKCIYRREYHYQNKIEEINRKFSRVDKIQLHLSEKILKFYDEWYDEYQKSQ